MMEAARASIIDVNVRDGKRYPSFEVMPSLHGPAEPDRAHARIGYPAYLGGKRATGVEIALMEKSNASSWTRVVFPWARCTRQRC